MRLTQGVQKISPDLSLSGQVQDRNAFQGPYYVARCHASEEALDLSEDIVAVRVRPAAVAAREFVPVKAISQHLVRARGLGVEDGGLSLEGFGIQVQG